MKVQEVPVFTPFAIRIEIDDPNTLRALIVAAGKMTNGHGLDLYDLLCEKAKDAGIILD